MLQRSDWSKYYTPITCDQGRNRLKRVRIYKHVAYINAIKPCGFFWKTGPSLFLSVSSLITGFFRSCLWAPLQGWKLLPRRKETVLYFSRARPYSHLSSQHLDVIWNEKEVRKSYWEGYATTSWCLQVTSWLQDGVLLTCLRRKMTGLNIVTVNNTFKNAAS